MNKEHGDYNALFIYIALIYKVLSLGNVSTLTIVS